MGGDPQFEDEPGFTTTWVIWPPHLLMGKPPAGTEATLVRSAEHALRVIEAGGTALLPPFRWDLAERVLDGLGFDKRDRVRILMWGQSGNTIPVEGLTPAQLDAALRGWSTRTGQSGCFCVGCGFFEAATPHEMNLHPERYLPAACPVCGGEGLPVTRPERPI